MVSTYLLVGLNSRQLFMQSFSKAKIRSLHYVKAQMLLSSFQIPAFQMCWSFPPSTFNT